MFRYVARPRKFSPQEEATIVQLVATHGVREAVRQWRGDKELSVPTAMRLFQEHGGGSADPRRMADERIASKSVSPTRGPETTPLAAPVKLPKKAKAIPLPSTDPPEGAELEAQEPPEWEEDGEAPPPPPGGPGGPIDLVEIHSGAVQRLADALRRCPVTQPRVVGQLARDLGAATAGLEKARAAAAPKEDTKKWRVVLYLPERRA